MVDEHHGTCCNFQHVVPSMLTFGSGNARGASDVAFDSDM